jgi:hypothetical protein
VIDALGKSLNLSNLSDLSERTVRLPSEVSQTAMHRRDDARLLDRAARVLFAGAPSALLARHCGVPKATARSWRQGNRRAPKHVLIKLRLMLQARAAQCNALCREFGIEIARREGEPLRRRGFMEIRERDGPGSVPRDGRNRLGRPRKR